MGSLDLHSMIQTAKPEVYFPNLDGLRFFCFLSVFFFHSFGTEYNEVHSHWLYRFIKVGLFSNGNLGVNFFFVLSGFLITYLLLVEKKHYGKIHIRQFYIRRFLRIWPLFFFCVFFGFYLFPILKQLNGEVPNETASIFYYLTFLNNFDFIKKGLPDASILGVLWSVAIEEQFYLIWPVLLSYIPQKYYKWLFLIIITVSFIFRLVYSDQNIILEHHTLSCISDMTVGAFGALLVFNNVITRALKNISRFYIYFLYILVVIVFIWRKELFHHNNILLAADRLIISILFLFIILEQCYSENSIFKMGNYKTVSGLGRITYGLYCLHFIGILVVAKGLAKLSLNQSVFEVIVIEGILSLLLTIIIAKVSFKYYEKPFLKLKSKFSFVK